MKVGYRIAELLKQQKKSRAALARHCDVSVQAVGHWIAGGSSPLAKKLRLIADFFDITEEELLFGAVAGRQSPKRVPIIRWDEARDPRNCVDNARPSATGDTFQVSVSVQRCTFALMVYGDSMLNPSGAPSFPEGTIIAVEPEMDAANGDCVIVRRAASAEAVFSQFASVAGQRLLKPLNPRYPILPMEENDEIVGVVREYAMRLK